jgi:phospholipid/cholesterol/gamma-HCH transport system ATP-binding protein
VTNTIIELSDVHMRFGNFEVHRGISFQIKQGEVVTLLGPSGTGKTVILKIIIGLLRATSGSVTVMGQQMESLSEDGLRELRRNIGMLFQGAALFDSLNVFENIVYSLREFGEDRPEVLRKVVKEKLEIVGLPGVAHKHPPELSGGQKKRVGLARALASSPKIILFDEPTTGLDPTTIRLIDELIVRLKEEFGITCLMVTHDIESARRVSDRWILIDKGKVVADGPVEMVCRENKPVMDFISGNWQAELIGDLTY